MLDRILQPLTQPAYALMRVVTGLAFAFHGIQKVLGILSEFQPPIGSQVWIGGLIELVAGLAIALGLFTRCAAFISSGTMAVAYAQFHWKFAFDSKFFPAVNQGELALVYAVLFFFMACYGSGILSLDGRRSSGSKYRGR